MVLFHSFLYVYQRVSIETIETPHGPSRPRHLFANAHAQSTRRASHKHQALSRQEPKVPMALRWIPKGGHSVFIPDRSGIHQIYIDLYKIFFGTVKYVK